MKNKLDDLRNHLFSTLEALSDPEKPMPIERAQAIANVAQTIINSAKVEVDVLKLYDGRVKGTDFVPIETLPPARPAVKAALNGGRHE